MKKLLYVLPILLVLAAAIFLDAEEIMRKAALVEITGTVLVKTPDKDELIPASKGMALGEADIVITKDASLATVEIESGEGKAKVDVQENSQVLILELAKDSATGKETTLLDLAVGKIFIKVDKLKEENSKFEVKTPTSVVGVRGTKFSVQVEAVE